MNKYKFKVTMVVEVEAFEESDAWDALQENFGIGEEYGVTVTSCEFDVA